MTDAHRDAELLAIAHAMADTNHPVKRDTSAWAATNLAQRDRIVADHSSSFARDDWARIAERGIFRLMCSPEVGGTGADVATVLLTLEGLGHGCRDNGLNFAVASQILSTQIALERFANADQQAQWLTPLLAGEVFAALAMTEADSGSDAYSLTATAIPQDDGSYVLNGNKAHITFGSNCDVAIVFASTNPDVGKWGISAFVVDMSLAGVDLVGNRDKMGMRTTPFGNITFTDVRLPADSLLGNHGSGASIFNAVLEVERSFVFISQVGAIERQIDDAVAFANEREQGGVPIAQHQVIAHRIVKLKEHHEAARLAIYKAALATVTGMNVPMASALAKITASETGIAAALDFTSIFGARGYVTEYEVERELRDAVGGLAYSGTRDIQRNIVARLLGLG